jgi:hypothetical protein
MAAWDKLPMTIVNLVVIRCHGGSRSFAEVASDQQRADMQIFVVGNSANKTYVAFSEVETYLAELTQTNRLSPSA